MVVVVREHLDDLARAAQAERRPDEHVLRPLGHERVDQLLRGGAADERRLEGPAQPAEPRVVDVGVEPVLVRHRHGRSRRSAARSRRRAGATGRRRAPAARPGAGARTPPNTRCNVRSSRSVPQRRHGRLPTRLRIGSQVANPGPVSGSCHPSTRRPRHGRPTAREAGSSSATDGSGAGVVVATGGSGCCGGSWAARARRPAPRAAGAEDQQRDGEAHERDTAPIMPTGPTGSWGSPSRRRCGGAGEASRPATATSIRIAAPANATW